MTSDGEDDPMHIFLVLPLLIPLVAAVAALLLWRSSTAQRWLGLLGTAGLLIASVILFEQVRLHGPQSAQIGGWPAPFGITLVADLLSAMLVVVTGIIGFAISVYSWDDIDEARASFGYYTLLLILLVGIVGSFLTGDLFNLYVWFEVMLIASFVLLALGGERPQLEGAVKYVTMNLVASALLLSAIAIVYGFTGTLNMADLAAKLGTLPPSGLLNAVALLFLTAFGVKAAIFPLFFWLPASYHTPPPAVSALFAGLLTKVGAYAAIRLFTLVFGGVMPTLILAAAGLTMVTGVLGAMAQRDCRRLLSFLVVSEMGFILLGLGLFTRDGLAATTLFLPHVMLAECAVFMSIGLIGKVAGSYDLARLGNLAVAYPFVAVVFLIPALSLAGMPPFAGIVAKLALVASAMQAGQYVMMAVALTVSLLTLYVMTKIWNVAFWAPSKEKLVRVPLSRPLLWSTGVVGSASVVLALAAGPLYTVALAAADQLLDPTAYIKAVLGEGP